MIREAAREEDSEHPLIKLYRQLPTDDDRKDVVRGLRARLRRAYRRELIPDGSA